MNTEIEQNGRAANVRKTAEYQTCVDEIIAGIDPEYSYVTLDGERVDEYTLIGRILSRAGVTWSCVKPDCRCINSHRDTSCVNCRGRKPKPRDIPKQDITI